MDMQNATRGVIDTLRNRRQQLAELIALPVILWSGCSSPRNFPANTFPFRASSHFLYFAGIPLEQAAIRLETGKLALLWMMPNQIVPSGMGKRQLEQKLLR